MLKFTLISHIFNEEYLLPMWLEYHKTIFENIIIIDYNSTDNSINICKSICPNATIINSRNSEFDAQFVDQEVMDIENGIEGFKIVLNTTEFLVCNKPLHEIFKDYENTNVCIRIQSYSPYSNKIEDINNYKKLFFNLTNKDVVFDYYRAGYRYIHNYNNGSYSLGRHDTSHHNIISSDNSLNIIWFGFYPMNEMILKRKLQIQERIPLNNKERGWGYQHYTNREALLQLWKDKSNTGQHLSVLNKDLYELIKNKFKYNILVIGGNGYIGTELVDKLKDKYNFDITILDTNYYIGSTKKRNDITYINANYKDLPASFYNDFTDIILLAGQSSVSNSKNLMNVIDNNIKNFSYLIEIINENQKFIYANSSSVYGNTNENEVDEKFNKTNGYIPYNYYDLSKQTIDSIIELSNKHYYSLRFGTVNGFSRNLRNDVMINSMIYNSKINNKIMTANNDINRPILGINDLCRAIISIIYNGKYELRGIYNLNSFNAKIGEITQTISDITNITCENINKNTNTDIINFKLQTNTYNFKINSNKFIKNFNFTFKDTITSIANDLIEKWDLIENLDNRLKDCYNEYKYTNDCKVCGEKTESLFDLNMQPLANNYITDLELKLKIEKKYPLHLHMCNKCYHLQLNCIVRPENLFNNYLYLSGTSRTLVNYFKEFAEKVLLETNKKGIIKILEIACNDCSLLDEFYKYNSEELKIITVGVDPARNIYENISSNKKEHDVYCNFFNEKIIEQLKNKYQTFDIIIAQNVIAHIDYPNLFLSYVKELMDDNTNVYIQTSQKNMILENQFDTIYHEHLSFFNTNSMNIIVKNNDLILNNVYENEIHGTSYIFKINKHKNDNSNFNEILEKEEKLGLYDKKTYDNYTLKCVQYKNNLLNKIIDYKLNDFQIIAFGSTAKSMTVFNYCNITNKYIDFIIDENELKQDLYTPGSNIIVCSINELKRINQNCIILITAWNFYEEIKTKIIVVLKEFNISSNVTLLNINSLDEEKISL
jgi:nucleoside-diphosphate-sugar epimerase/2-polyprenyl-3-methyl-5-hydroxy-6-metoxy-1,4-benzoquinol methylase